MTWNKKHNNKQNISLFFNSKIWNDDYLSNFGKIKNWFIKQIKIVVITVQNFTTDSLGLQAVALSFFTTMSFVPFVAVLLSVTKRIGLSKVFNRLVYQTFDNQQVIDYIIHFANNIVNTAKQGPYGAISFLVFIWLIIWLMLFVEKSFNKIWKVSVSRLLWKRIISYIVILIISPFVIMLFLTMSIGISDLLKNLGVIIPFFGGIRTLFKWIIFYFFATAVFTALFCFIPNAKVKFIPSLKSALISAFAFTVVQYLYLETQLLVSRLNAVYGVFAAVPLFMVWVNIGWSIILIGSVISYSFQNIEKYNTEYNKLYIK